MNSLRHAPGEGRSRFYADRAPRRDHHPRDPACDRDPSYLSFRTRANKSAAQANVRAAVPGMEAFNADHATGYTGVTLTKLQGSYDAGIKNIKISVATLDELLHRQHVPGTVQSPQVRVRPATSRRVAARRDRQRASRRARETAPFVFSGQAAAYEMPIGTSVSLSPRVRILAAALFVAVLALAAGLLVLGGGAELLSARRSGRSSRCTRSKKRCGEAGCNASRRSSRRRPLRRSLGSQAQRRTPALRSSDGMPAALAAALALARRRGRLALRAAARRVDEMATAEAKHGSRPRGRRLRRVQRRRREDRLAARFAPHRRARRAADRVLDGPSVLVFQRPRTALRPLERLRRPRHRRAGRRQRGHARQVSAEGASPTPAGRELFVRHARTRRPLDRGHPRGRQRRLLRRRGRGLPAGCDRSDADPPRALHVRRCPRGDGVRDRKPSRP